jgi:hypothetical protein
MERNEATYQLLKMLEGNDQFREVYQAAHGEDAVENLAARLKVSQLEEKVHEMSDAEYAKHRRQLLEGAAL